MALFQRCDSAGVFTPPTNGLFISLAILRASGSQTSAGEWVNTFSQVNTLTGWLLPTTTDYKRYLQGIHPTYQAVGTFITTAANPDIREGDRAVFSAVPAEVTSIDRWGTHCEIDWSYLGR